MTSGSKPVAFWFSEAESRRFKRNIYRAFMQQLVVQEFEQLAGLNADTIILRLPAEKQYQLSQLHKLGFDYYIGDTLVYYSMQLEMYQPKQLSNHGLDFLVVTEEYVDVLEQLVEIIFRGYINHYNANPILNQSDVLDGYKEWAKVLATTEDTVWIVKQNGAHAGFIACSIKDSTAEVILNGVMPTMSKQGIYTDLIRFVQKHCKEKNCSTLKISSQVHNYAVQKVWVREGFRLENAFVTVHVNCTE